MYNGNCDFTKAYNESYEKREEDSEKKREGKVCIGLEVSFVI